MTSDVQVVVLEGVYSAAAAVAIAAFMNGCSFFCVFIGE